MEAYQERVIDELCELDKRMMKLHVWLEIQKKIGHSHPLLVKQLDAMRVYSDILSKRVREF